MKKLLFMIIVLSPTATTHADIFDDLEKEAVLVEKYCVSGEGQVNEEMNTVRNEKTNKIVSQKMERIVYCRNATRHVANDKDKFEVQAEQTDSGLGLLDMSRKPHNCVFADSLLEAMCGQSKYIYLEFLSGAKRKKLPKLYRFIKASSPQDSSVVDSCYPAPPELSKQNSGKILKCNNFGVAIIRTDE